MFPLKSRGLDGMENGWSWVSVLAEEERAGASRLLPDRITSFETHNVAWWRVVTCAHSRLLMRWRREPPGGGGDVESVKSRAKETWGTRLKRGAGRHLAAGAPRKRTVSLVEIVPSLDSRVTIRPAIEFKSEKIFASENLPLVLASKSLGMFLQFGPPKIQFISWSSSGMRLLCYAPDYIEAL